jgi:hypothetical protein
MIKFVSDLRQIGGFHRVLRFASPIKLTEESPLLHDKWRNISII